MTSPTPGLLTRVETCIHKDTGDRYSREESNWQV